jgi:hypothetical protein
VRCLGLLVLDCHPEDVVSTELADELGMVSLDVSADLRNELIVRVCLYDLSAFAIDALAHWTYLPVAGAASIGLLTGGVVGETLGTW